LTSLFYGKKKDFIIFEKKITSSLDGRKIKYVPSSLVTKKPAK